MPYNGSGVFTLVSGNPVVTGTVISSTVQNNTMADIVNNGLTNCLTKDGQQTPTANIPLGGFRITGVGDAINAQDATTAKQIQNGGLQTLVSVSGTDTITASSVPAITAYASSQVFYFEPAGANTTTTVTLNINAIGAKAVKKATQAGLIALAVGDIAAGVMQNVIYDGTQFILQSPSITNPGRLLRTLIYTLVAGVQNVSVNGGAPTTTGASTYTPLTAMNFVDVEGVGGGGASSGAANPTAGLVSLGAPGKCGAYGRSIFTAATIGASQSVVVGTGGVGVSAGTGATGSQTSLGVLLTIPGGTGGGILNNQTPPVINGNGGLTGLPTGANVLAIPGIAPGASTAISASLNAIWGGAGGTSKLGAGSTQNVGNANGINGASYGDGAAGVAILNGGGPANGGSGFNGILIIREYA
jgi:hypothetical protein